MTEGKLKTGNDLSNSIDKLKELLTENDDIIAQYIISYKIIREKFRAELRKEAENLLAQLQAEFEAL